MARRGLIRQKRKTPRSPEPPIEWPRFTIACLLVWMVFVAVISYTVHAIGAWTLLLAFLFAPTIIGATVGVMDWSHPDQAMRLIRWLLYSLLIVYGVASIALQFFLPGAVLFALGALPFILAAWGVQYATVGSAFD